LNTLLSVVVGVVVAHTKAIQMALALVVAVERAVLELALDPSAPVFLTASLWRLLWVVAYKVRPPACLGLMLRVAV
jgi:hypothetical protein